MTSLRESQVKLEGKSGQESTSTRSPFRSVSPRSMTTASLSAWSTTSAWTGACWSWWGVLPPSAFPSRIPSSTNACLAKRVRIFLSLPSLICPTAPFPNWDCFWSIRNLLIVSARLGRRSASLMIAAETGGGSLPDGTSLSRWTDTRSGLPDYIKEKKSMMLAHYDPNQTLSPKQLNLNNRFLSQSDIIFRYSWDRTRATRTPTAWWGGATRPCSSTPTHISLNWTLKTAPFPTIESWMRIIVRAQIVIHLQ
jgi:hypothetical protein